MREIQSRFGFAFHSLGLCQLRSRLSHVGFRFDNFGLGAVQFRSKRPRIDYEKQVAFVNNLTFLEMDRLQVATDSRPHFHKIHSIKATDVLVPFDDRLLDWSRDNDLDCRRLLLSG